MTCAAVYTWTLINFNTPSLHHVNSDPSLVHIAIPDIFWMIFNLFPTQPNVACTVSSSTISPSIMLQVPSISLVTVPFPFPSLAIVTSLEVVDVYTVQFSPQLSHTT